MTVRALKVEFDGAHGAKLAARLDLPSGPVRCFALFAHCFTCSKDIAAARNIASALVEEGIGVLRFDFTGLGGSGGDFASTDFSSNVEDLKHAAEYLRREHEAPQLLIGHSLGGAAVLSVAGELEEVRAVATIGAPADVAHVLKNMDGSLEEIESAGQGTVVLADRTFTIRREFVEDARMQRLEAKIAHLGKALMVMHAPLDDVVGIGNATDIFVAAKHPKSFVSLDQADHLLSREQDAAYAARVIATWAERYIEPLPRDDKAPAGKGVRVAETGLGSFQSRVTTGAHAFLADEPEAVGGLDSGPSPYDFLSTALGACTVMTLRMYADRKKLPVGRITTSVLHGKVHAQDCEDCGGELKARGGRIDRFERCISIEGDLEEATRQRLLEIADKCPVHRTLEAGAAVVTRLEPEG